MIAVDLKYVILRATIDQLEDFEYSSDVNDRLGIRYNYPPAINLTHRKEVVLRN